VTWLHIVSSCGFAVYISLPTANATIAKFKEDKTLWQAAARDLLSVGS
jgi:hypothetical protein